MHSIQLIKGKRIFTVIETLAGCSSARYSYPLEDMAHVLKCHASRANPNCIDLPVIHVADREVKRIAETTILN